MKKVDPFFGFLWIYFFLTGLSVFFYLLFAPSGNSFYTDLGTATALTSLTQTIELSSYETSAGFRIFSLFITQLSGLALLTYLFWYCRQLLGNIDEKARSLFAAFKLTLLISTITESMLFVFFLYGTSGMSMENNLLSSVALAVNSFMNAGNPASINQTIPRLISQNFIMQLGIIAGSNLGSLGIYVLYELFSPKKLRQRLADTSVDWSLITKISVFATILLFAGASTVFYFTEYQHSLQHKKIIDSVIASLYEIASVRGFGYFLTEQDTWSASKYVKLVVSIFGAGPFSTGGGLTLLGLFWVFTSFRKTIDKNSNLYTIGLITRNLIKFVLVAFTTLLCFRLAVNSDLSAGEVLFDQWKLFATLQINFQNLYGPAEILTAALTLTAGRLSFISVCFLTLRQLKKRNLHASDFLRV